jgi:hypothetical protein
MIDVPTDQDVTENFCSYLIALVIRDRQSRWVEITANELPA